MLYASIHNYMLEVKTDKLGKRKIIQLSESGTSGFLSGVKSPKLYALGN